MTERHKAVGWSLVFLAGGFALALIVLGLMLALVRPALTGGALLLPALQTGVLLVVYSLLTWLIGRRVLGVRAGDLGLVPVRAGVRGFGRGFLFGCVLAALAMAAAVALGRAAWRGDGGTPASWLGTLAVTTAFLLPAALVEELMFRGVPMVALSRSFGRGTALVALTVLFALAHIMNTSVTALALLNIGLAGVFLGLAFFTSGGLWTSTGAHLGWNLTLAGLAAPVSGLLLPMPWLDYAAREPGWLTGGAFGPEGGVLATLCLGAGAFVASRRTVRENPA